MEKLQLDTKIQDYAKEITTKSILYKIYSLARAYSVPENWYEDMSRQSWGLDRKQYAKKCYVLIHNRQWYEH